MGGCPELVLGEARESRGLGSCEGRGCSLGGGGPVEEVGGWCDEEEDVLGEGRGGRGYSPLEERPEFEARWMGMGETVAADVLRGETWAEERPLEGEGPFCWW